MTRVHFDIVAAAGNRFAIGHELQPREIDDRTGRSVFTWNPLWIDQCQRSWIHRNCHVRVEEFARCFRRVDAQHDWPWGDVSFGGNELKVEKNNGGKRKQRQPQFSIHYSEPLRMGMKTHDKRAKRGVIIVRAVGSKISLIDLVT